jgi:hypothetical protein
VAVRWAFFVKLFTNQNIYFMGYQNISVSVVQADIDAVKTAIATINTKLPFLVTLDKKEVKSLVKLGEKSADFFNDCQAAVTGFPQILPPSFDKAEFGKDASLFKALNEIKLHLDSLYEKLHTTHMAVGSEAMVASLEVYAYVQTASERVPGLRTLAAKMKERFKKNGVRKKKEGSEKKN